MELWSGASADTGAPPRFLICTSAADRFATTIEALAEAPRGMTLPATELGVDVVATDHASPPGLPALIPPDAAQRAGCLMIDRSRGERATQSRRPGHPAPLR